MSKKRINLTELEKRFTEGLGGPYTVLQMDLISELKKIYAREDELLDALRIIRDDLGDILPSNDSQELALNKIRNFANDASL